MSGPEVYPVLLAILGMTAVTYLMRVGGFWLMGRVPLTPRIRRMLDALPGAVVCATIVPLVIKNGLPAGLGLIAVVAILALRGHEFLAVFAGVGLVALARAGGF